MNQYYFVVSWDEEDGWRVDDDTASIVFTEGLVYDSDTCEWRDAMTSDEEKADLDARTALTLLLKQ